MYPPQNIYIYPRYDIDIYFHLIIDIFMYFECGPLPISRGLLGY